MKEKWKSVETGSFYEVSNLGRVRAREHSSTYTNCHGMVKTLNYPTRLLNPQAHKKTGRLSVSIDQKTTQVSRLVALAWVRNHKPGVYTVVRHLDDNPLNNRADNLAWGTPKMNSEDAVRNGLFRRGSKCTYAKFTEASVRKIKRALARGVPGAQIADNYGVSQSAISAIKTGRTWAHVN
ncbi:NUMOD4 domain-containing protein [Burkholderia cepacia]|uniref:NUMOD4 domain-containing protein n=1 Tax=Burkholderia cepacia TaxID=292 RepID=UPI0009BE1068|nr:NUMOD4 domain-containing protein [Burkholderia cepacia]